MVQFLKIGALPLFSLILFLSSCGSGTPERSKLSPEQIESKYSSGVVLIKNLYYYTISFGGGKEFYFSGLDSNGDPENLTMDPNEIIPSVAFGTGFFISKDGHIVTNSHIASPSIDLSTLRSKIIEAFNAMANEWTKEVNDLNERLGVLRVAILTADSYYDRQQCQESYNQIEEERNSIQEAINAVHSIGGMDYKATLNTDLGIAYNDTHVTNISDFIDCVEVADDPQHDLAILQLKSKSTPEKKHVFKIPSGKKSTSESDENNNSKKGIKVGKQLYMIGYNLGPALALTNQGIKAQVTSGSVSQDTDDTKIMYEIPALHGSSGAPVIDEYGKLVAINFAGLDITQNFNYGIKVSHLKKLFNELKGDND